MPIQIEGWLGRGCWRPNGSFRKVIGHRQIPLLQSWMANAASRKSIAATPVGQRHEQRYE